MAEVAKVLNIINLGNKYSWAISNADINATGDLRLTGIKKYWKCAGQIQEEIDGLYKNWIPTLRAFIKYS